MDAPEKGFYYHHKHDPSISVNNYAYEVFGVAKHTEDGTHSVIYKPLYESEFLDAANFYNRPLDMFTEKIEKEGKTTSRFTKITDEAIINKLIEIKSSLG